MRIVLQRVTEADVVVEGRTVGAIGQGLLLPVGVEHDDTAADARAAADKIAGLRLFADEEGLMNLSIGDVGGAALAVSQFTLMGKVRRGRRPSFTAAAGPDVAEPLFAELVDALRSRGVSTETGVFGAVMDVGLRNDGPVTLVIEVSGGKVR